MGTTFKEDNIIQSGSTEWRNKTKPAAYPEFILLNQPVNFTYLSTSKACCETVMSKATQNHYIARAANYRVTMVVREYILFTLFYQVRPLVGPQEMERN